MFAIIMPSLPAVPQEPHSFLSIERGWHNDLLNFLQNGLPKVLVAVVLSVIAQRLVAFGVKRLRRRADLMTEKGQRAAQLRTIAGMVRASAYGLIGFYLFIQILGAVGVPLGPFIASAGVIGLGVSFGAQSIFKDVLNGIFILIEDQYNVGDVVKVAGLQGSVEDLTLRITKLRDGDGTLYIVPNSQIATVSNLSRDFSVASLQVSVSAAENPDRVVALLKKLSSELRAEQAFRGVLLADPEVLGIDKISGQEVVYPINIRVQANQRDGVLRELRRRVLLAFAKDGITFGTPGATVLLQHPDPTATPASSGTL